MGTPFESLDGRGFCKKSLQNLERQGVRGQNLDNKGVKRRSAIFAYAASALTMICLLNLRVKVRCHNGAVEKSRCRSGNIWYRRGQRVARATVEYLMAGNSTQRFHMKIPGRSSANIIEIQECRKTRTEAGEGPIFMTSRALQLKSNKVAGRSNDEQKGNASNGDAAPIGSD